MKIVPIPCLRDNYAYLVVCESTGKAAVVDPSESAPVLEAVHEAGVDLVAVWNTHHHYDHVGGNTDIAKAIAGVAVLAHESDSGRVPGQTVKLADGDEFSLGDTIRGTVIFNPGHTTGAISYYIAQHSAVFTGDTLFGAGCGRMFEGDQDMMHASLMKLAALSEDTRVYCGHEYTEANLRFATAVEPKNLAIAARRDKVADQRSRGEFTVPSTIAEERATNPFLRAAEPDVIAAAKEHGPTDTPAAVFGTLRAWKDGF